MTDYDGNVYETVLIGNQCWMKENLKVTHYRNGDPIPNVTDDAEWPYLTTGAYCNYLNDEFWVSYIGRLYNWHAVVDARGIAPVGWHVPTDEEWKQLEMYLGMSPTDADAEGWRGTDEGGKLKESETLSWNSPNTGATNESGFTALAAGWRYASFFGLGETARFWTTTEAVRNIAWERLLSYNSAQIRRTHPNDGHGLSLRCVRDITKYSNREDYICGDANSDGALNVSDAVFIVNHVFIGGPAPNSGCCVDCPPTVIDYDGNVYETVVIGDQCWMKENLKVTHYRNGDAIPNVTDWYDWFASTSGAYCNYGNYEGNSDVYGRLYNWYAVDDSRGLAPEGWHVPSDAEWKQLEIYLGMSQAGADDINWRGWGVGGKLKEAGTEHWTTPNEGATNESGFTALPGGVRIQYFESMFHAAEFWTSSLYDFNNYPWYRGLSAVSAAVDRLWEPKHSGLSVRCIKDQ